MATSDPIGDIQRGPDRTLLAVIRRKEQHSGMSKKLPLSPQQKIALAAGRLEQNIPPIVG